MSTAAFSNPLECAEVGVEDGVGEDGGWMGVSVDSSEEMIRGCRRWEVDEKARAELVMDGKRDGLTIILNTSYSVSDVWTHGMARG